MDNMSPEANAGRRSLKRRADAVEDEGESAKGAMPELKHPLHVGNLSHVAEEEWVPERMVAEVFEA